MTSPLIIRYREGAEFELSPDLAVVKPALAKLQSYLTERGMPDAEWNALQLATAEALNNAIIHGGQKDPASLVRLRWSWIDQDVEIRVRDAGHFEPPPHWHELPEDPLAESGRGGYLISEYFDHVKHVNSDLGHEIIMQKRLGRAQQPTNAAAVENELQLMMQDLSDSYESLAAMFNISALLATSTSFNEFLRGVLSRLQELISVDLVYAKLHDEESGWSVDFHRANEQIARPESAPTPLEQKVWESHQLLALESTNELSDDDPLKHWTSALMVGPVEFQGRPIGLMVAGRQSGPPFTAGQTNLLRTVADFVGVAHTTAALHRHREEQLREMRELEIAAQIQKSLLPTKFPTTEHWSVYGECESARAVGGDFFDVVTGPDGHILILIADVMGKGVPAAMFSSLLRASARARLDLATDPGKLLTELNRLLADDLAALGMFITAQVISLKPDGSSLDVATAGHPSPLVFAPGATTATELETNGGMPLGVLPDTDYSHTSVHLEPSEILMIGTDGLYEIEDAADKMLGFDNLAALLPQHWSGQLPAFICATFNHLSSIEYGKQADDRTMVVLTRKPSAPTV